MMHSFMQLNLFTKMSNAVIFTISQMIRLELNQAMLCILDALQPSRHQLRLALIETIRINEMKVMDAADNQSIDLKMQTSVNN